MQHSMAERAKFPAQQVDNAIRAGLREGRRSVDLPSTEAEIKGVIYRENLEHYLEHVQTSLNSADYLQAAEKSWGAYAQTIKAIASDYEMGPNHHASIIGVADALAQLASGTDVAAGDALRHGLSTARSLHQHFYENDLSGATVTANVMEVNEAIALMQDLFARGDSTA